MKKIGLFIVISVLMVSFSPIEANALDANDTVLRYLGALRNGNIETIKDSITGEMYNNSKVLLEQNKSYSVFLKKIYRDAKFQIRDTTVNNNEAIVKVESKFPDGKTIFIFYLNKNGEGDWKIFKETAAP